MYLCVVLILIVINCRAANAQTELLTAFLGRCHLLHLNTSSQVCARALRLAIVNRLCVSEIPNVNVGSGSYVLTVLNNIQI